MTRVPGTPTPSVCIYPDEANAQRHLDDVLRLGACGFDHSVEQRHA